MEQQGNPIIRHKYTADPTVIVHEDKVYLYTGHDEPPAGSNSYVMKQWLCFSSSDLKDRQEHPSPLQATDFDWADGDAFASKMIAYRNRFYWFVSLRHGRQFGKAIGVAVADHPAGPFRDAIGAALITHDMLPQTRHENANLDPTVLIEDNGDAFICWGNKQCYFAQLQPDLCALAGDIRILDLPGFAEGAHLHKRKATYYLAYGYDHPEKVAYATSSHIRGPWQFKGIINEIAGNCETNRPAIIDFKGKSYFFYHNGALPEGNSYRRSVCIEHLYYNEDGTIKRIVMSTEGIA